MESMGPSIVRLKGVVSKTYLCMNDEGVCHIMVSVIKDFFKLSVLLRGWTLETRDPFLESPEAKF